MTIRHNSNEEKTDWSEGQKRIILVSQNMWIALKERRALQMTFSKEVPDIEFLLLQHRPTLHNVNQHLGLANHPPLNEKISGIRKEVNDSIQCKNLT